MTLSPGIYGFADLSVGDRIETGWREISTALIDDFARVSGDHYAIHMSEQAAQARGFAGRVAHGLLVLSVIDGLKNNATAQIDALASLGWDWSFKAPVLAGDRVRACFTIAEKRITQSGQRGIIRCDAEAVNQRGEIVQAGCNRLIFDL